MTLVRWMIAGLSVVAMLLAGAMFSSDAPKHAVKNVSAAAASARLP